MLHRFASQASLDPPSWRIRESGNSFRTNSQSHSSRMPGIKRKGTERIGKHRNTKTLPRNSHGQTASSISDDEGSTLQQMLLDFFKARLLRDSSCLCDKIYGYYDYDPKPYTPLAPSRGLRGLSAPKRYTPKH